MFCLLFTDVRSPCLQNIQSWYIKKKYFTKHSNNKPNKLFKNNCNLLNSAKKQILIKHVTG